MLFGLTLKLMKKKLSILFYILAIVFLVSTVSYAASIYPFTGDLTGGGAGALDKKTGTADKDAAAVFLNQDHGTYAGFCAFYTLNADGGAGSDNAPWLIDSGDTGEDWDMCKVWGLGLATGNGATGPGFIEFYEDTDNGSNKVTLIGPASTADITVTLPSAAGTLLNSDGDGGSLTNLDGENIQSDSIDDDSIDFTDVTCVDITMTDCGAVTSTGTITAADGFDITGAADLDIGSADVTDVTIITDGDAADFIIGNNADVDYGITFDSDSNDATVLWDEANEELEFASSGGETLLLDLNTATDNQISFGTSSGVTNFMFVDDITIGNDTDGQDYVLTFDGNAGNLTQTWMEDEHELRISDSAGEGLDFDLDTSYDNQVAITSQTGVVNIHTAIPFTSGAYTLSITGSCTFGTDCDGTSTRALYGGVIYALTGNPITITLSAVGAGMNFTVITIGAIAVHVDPNASDKMYLDGTLLDDGDKASNTSTTGDMLVCTYYSADGYYCASGSPDGDHWTDGS